MNYLLDTHALLWFLLADERLSSTAQSAIADRRNTILVSPASFWEIAIKISLRKYRLDEDFTQFMERELAVNGFTLLPIGVTHAGAVAQLPYHHRDPFDRLPIAQALVERVPLVSKDTEADQYGVTRVW